MMVRARIRPSTPGSLHPPRPAAPRGRPAPPRKLEPLPRMLPAAATAGPLARPARPVRPPRPPPPPAADGLIEGWTMLRKPLKRGAHGWPELAFRTGDAAETPYVVKRLLGGLRKPGQTTGETAREIRALQRLRHPNVIELVDYGRDTNGMEYLIMPYFANGHIGKSELRGKPLPVRLNFFLRLCDGLNHAHACGVSHGDLCPQNILLGGAGEPIIIDFGCCNLDFSEEMPTRPATPPAAARHGTTTWPTAVRVDCGSAFSILAWLLHDGRPLPHWPRMVTTPPVVPEAMRASFDGLLAEFLAIERSLSPIFLTAAIERLKAMLDAWPVEAPVAHTEKKSACVAYNKTEND